MPPPTADVTRYDDLQTRINEQWVPISNSSNSLHATRANATIVVNSSRLTSSSLSSERPASREANVAYASARRSGTGSGRAVVGDCARAAAEAWGEALVGGGGDWWRSE
eukprot:scaffold18870_cov35-Tisochrysis_lutea.AAC.1